MTPISTRRRRYSIGAAFLVFLTAAGIGTYLLMREQANGATNELQEPAGTSLAAISVKTVHPRLNKNFRMTVERPADVEAYYSADIEARVPGVVKWIRVAPGSAVEKDQPLVRIDVPDLEATRKEKAITVIQREKELQLAKAKVGAAEAAVDTAKANVKEKEALLRQAKAEKLYRQQQYSRLASLRSSNSIDQNVVDEAARNLELAEAREMAATQSILKAESELLDAKANLRVAEAEVEQRKQLIDVAKADEQYAGVLVEFANVKAPFRGDVIHRKVDPGSFVQNASTGHPTPILSLERSDIVTVVMRVPDNYAPFVSAGTEAIIQLDALPGLKIHGKVTRFAPSLVTAAHDRTMRVEVDLWNGTLPEYQKYFGDPNQRADLKDGPLPLMPEFGGKNALNRSTHLLPGMYGQMTLVLRSFGDTYLVPTQAIIRQGGRPYVYVVRDGKAHMLPVEVQVDDGTLAKVERLSEDGQVLGDLSANEEVVVTNQEELTEGQPLNPTPLEGWTSADGKVPY
jgi:HlyD family secretion protein